MRNPLPVNSISRGHIVLTPYNELHPDARNEARHLAARDHEATGFIVGFHKQPRQMPVIGCACVEDEFDYRALLSPETRASLEEWEKRRGR